MDAETYTILLNDDLDAFRREIIEGEDDVDYQDLMAIAISLNAKKVFDYLVDTSDENSRSLYVARQLSQIDSEDDYNDTRLWEIVNKGINDGTKDMWIYAMIRQEDLAALQLPPIQDRLSYASQYLFSAVTHFIEENDVIEIEEIDEFISRNPQEISLQILFYVRSFLQWEQVLGVLFWFSDRQEIDYILRYNALNLQLSDIPNVGELETHRDLIVDLLDGNPISRSKAKLIHAMYGFPNARRYTPRTLRAAVVDAQEALGAMCVNTDDYITYDSIKKIPFPFVARLPMPNGSTVCVSVLDLVQYPEPINPLSREALDTETLTKVREQVNRLLTIMRA